MTTSSSHRYFASILVSLLMFYSAYSMHVSKVGVSYRRKEVPVGDEVYYDVFIHALCGLGLLIYAIRGFLRKE